MCHARHGSQHDRHERTRGEDQSKQCKSSCPKEEHQEKEERQEEEEHQEKQEEKKVAVLEVTEAAARTPR